MHPLRLRPAIGAGCVVLLLAGCRTESPPQRPTGSDSKPSPATKSSAAEVAFRPSRIVTWNIHGGRGGLANIVAALRELAPDVVLLQEAEVDSPQSPHANQAELIARDLGFNWVSAGSPLDDGGQQHMAILSRAALRDSVALDASTGRQYGITAIVEATPPIRVVSVHLTATFKGEWNHINNSIAKRDEEVKHLARAAGDWIAKASRKDAALLIGGDFNMPPEVPLAAPLQNALRCLVPSGPTFSTDNPSSRIDYFFASPCINGSAERAESPASDHFPVVLNLSQTTSD